MNPVALGTDSVVNAFAGVKSFLPAHPDAHVFKS